jgi:hypothetical protein
MSELRAMFSDLCRRHGRGVIIRRLAMIVIPPAWVLGWIAAWVTHQYVLGFILTASYVITVVLVLRLLDKQVGR